MIFREPMPRPKIFDLCKLEAGFWLESERWHSVLLMVLSMWLHVQRGSLVFSK